MQTTIAVENYIVIDLQNNHLMVNVLKLKDYVTIENEIFDLVGVITFRDHTTQKLKEYRAFYKKSCKTWFYQNFYDGKEHKVTKNYKESHLLALMMYIPRNKGVLIC